MNLAERTALGIIVAVASIAVLVVVFLLAFRYGYQAGVHFAYRPTPYGDNAAVGVAGAFWGVIVGPLATLVVAGIEGGVFLAVVLRRRRATQSHSATIEETP